MMLWVRWAVGVVALIGIPLVWVLDPSSNNGCDEPSYIDGCDYGVVSGGPVSILLTLALLVAAMWAIFTAKRDD